MKRDLPTLAQNILMVGPARVMINAEGEAVASARAREQFGVDPDVIFIRDDGWSLGAPKQFETVAFKLWEGSWIGFLRKPHTAARPMSEYTI